MYVRLIYRTVKFADSRGPPRHWAQPISRFHVEQILRLISKAVRASRPRVAVGIFWLLCNVICAFSMNLFHDLIIPIFHRRFLHGIVDLGIMDNPWEI